MLTRSEVIFSCSKGELGPWFCCDDSYKVLSSMVLIHGLLHHRANDCLHFCLPVTRVKQIWCPGNSITDSMWQWVNRRETEQHWKLFSLHVPLQKQTPTARSKHSFKLFFFFCPQSQLCPIHWEKNKKKKKTVRRCQLLWELHHGL